MANRIVFAIFHYETKTVRKFDVYKADGKRKGAEVRIKRGLWSIEQKCRKNKGVGIKFALINIG